MALDMNSQELDSMKKKKVSELRSIVSNFQQQLQNQMAIYNQFLNQKLNEMIENARTQSIIREEARILHEEVRNTVSKAVLYTKPDGSPQLQIESGGTTETKPGIRNKGETVLDQYSDFKSNNIRVTASLDNGRGEEKENSEKVQPIEKKRELVVGEGSSNYIFELGGYESTKQRYSDSPESGELGWRPDPGSDPPDRNFSIPLVDPSSDSSTSLSSIDKNKERNEKQEESDDYCESDPSLNESGIHSDLIHPVYQLPPVSPIGFLQPHDSTCTTTVFIEPQPLLFSPPWNSTEAVEWELSVGNRSQEERSETTARPISIHTLWPKPNRVISTWARLMPINISLDFVAFKICRGIWLGGDHRKPLPPPLPPPSPWPTLLSLLPWSALLSPPLPPPRIPCVLNRWSPNFRDTLCNRCLEKVSRFSTFDTYLHVKETEKKSQIGEADNQRGNGCLKEKSQEAEYVKEKNQKMEVLLNCIAGVLGTKIIKLEEISSGWLGVVHLGNLLRSIMDILEIKTYSGYRQQHQSGHSAGPISTLCTRYSTLIQSSNSYATQFTQFAAVLKERRNNKVWCKSSLVHSTHETKGFSVFQIAELDRWSSTMILKNGGERMLNCKGLILMPVGWRAVDTGQQRFLYFFYPP